MNDRADQDPSCSLCCHWAPNLRGEVAPEGICRKLVENPAYYGSLITEAGDKCDAWSRLGVFRDAKGQLAEDRRVALRNRLNLPARLRTLSGDRTVRLADLSEFGAGISMSNLPHVGTPGILEWSHHKMPLTVAWANDDSCGAAFDAPISMGILLEAVRDGALKNNRLAEPSRIAHGIKRASLPQRPSYC